MEKHVASGNYYEAQQMLKTIYHRHRSRKHFQESYEILKGGAVMQLEKRQVTCGVELGLLMMEAYSKDKVSVSSESMSLIKAIIASFPTPLIVAGEGAAAAAAVGGPSGGGGASVSSQESIALDELSRLVGAATKWALKQGCNEDARSPHDSFGNLHDSFGKYIWDTFGWKGLGRASKHFARGSNTNHYATALKECCKLAPTESGLLICRAVLQVLAMSRTKASTDYQIDYAQALLIGFGGAQPLDEPLAHFCDMYLSAEVRALAGPRS
eukprot:gene27490-4796_t